MRFFGGAVRVHPASLQLVVEPLRLVHPPLVVFACFATPGVALLGALEVDGAPGGRELEVVADVFAVHGPAQLEVQAVGGGNTCAGDEGGVADVPRVGVEVALVSCSPGVVGVLDGDGALVRPLGSIGPSSVVIVDGLYPPAGGADDVMGGGGAVVPDFVNYGFALTDVHKVMPSDELDFLARSSRGVVLAQPVYFIGL